MKKSRKATNVLEPKPVHPRAMRTHGLFGIPYIRQHMVVDKKWTPSSLTEQFQGMSDLLSKRLTALRLENKSTRKNIVKQYRILRTQCKNGRNKLRMVLSGSNTHAIRNFLIKHKELQRLYQRMPIHLVVDNINQRTFVMRKERDRLRYRLGQLKTKYHDRLVERATVENRIKYENEFILIEEKKAWELRKKLENSSVRLKAIRTINGTYNKMLQVLRYDSIFYEPILQSLDNDIADQAQFIKHILFLGMPAISKFKELREEYRVYEERVRKDFHAKMQLLNAYKNADLRRATLAPPKAKIDPLTLRKRYVRETSSMITLKNDLEKVENKIKRVKMATLCSQAKEVFSRIISQVQNNAKLHKTIENDILGHEAIEIKMNRAQVFQGLLINNLTEEEKERQRKIETLQGLIKNEEETEAQILAYLKNRADAYVLLRFSLWNLFDILRHVGTKMPKMLHMEYPLSYLRLPLLKFELFNMRSVPPPVFETEVAEIMNIVKRKVQKLTEIIPKDLKEQDMQKHMSLYHIHFLDFTEDDDIIDEVPEPADTDSILELKFMQGIPSRKQLKTESAKIVEESSKKDEQ